MLFIRPGTSRLDRVKVWARAVKRDVVALWLAARDRRVPWYAKAWCMAIAAYALSPIDLIPDFIPIIGYLDDLVLLPLAIMLAVRMIPANIMADLRQEADRRAERPRSRIAAFVFAAIWLAAALLTVLVLWPKT